MTTSKGGCGCGGKSGGSGGCGCSKSTAMTTGAAMSATVCSPCDAGAFSRPQFFAGQLLTEDDLDAIETYVVGKNRLHNSRLFGAGVVCGLDVTCGACDTMTIQVAPGYALDCCGNDLVLSCDREIDLRPLITALRAQKTGGTDCGDPCAPANTSSAATQPSTAPAASISSVAIAPAATPPKTTKSPTFDYCLYARYTETPTDPTTAYPTGGDCTTVTCQPTRIREGVTFELRCSGVTAPDDVVTSLAACLGRLSAPDKQVANSRRIETASAEMKRAIPRYLAGATALNNDEQAQWAAAQPALQHVVNRGQAYTPTPSELVTWAELLVDTYGLYARQASAEVAKPASAAATSLAAAPPPPPPPPQQSDSLATALSAYGYIATALAAKGAIASIPNLLDQAFATAVTVSYPGLAATGNSGDARLMLVNKQTSFAMQLAYYGAVLTPALLSAYVVASQDLRAQLINAVSCGGGSSTDCALFDDLRSLSLPSPTQGQQDTSQGDATDLAHYGHKLGGLVRRFFADCICRALNPPCPACDDPGVLLACIKVRDCHVIEVCNMARSYVWSPAAMRYWLPPLTWLGDLVEQLCCATGCGGDDKLRAGFNTDARSQFVYSMIKHPSVESLAYALPAFYNSPAYLPTVTAAGRELLDLTARRILPSNLGATTGQTAPAPDVGALDKRISRLEELMKGLS